MSHGGLLSMVQEEACALQLAKYGGVSLSWSGKPLADGLTQVLHTILGIWRG